MKLLHEIFRCPNVEACLSNPNSGHPCSKVVSSQDSHNLGEHLMPEPWSGHLETAPVLFLSSNPGFSTPDGNSNEYPTLSWPDEWIEDYFVRRFERWIKDGCFGLRKDGTYNKSVYFWSATQKRASELLMRDDVCPGKDYALTEVVHCPSASQAGVGAALDECTGRYLHRLLEQSGAKAIVCLGQMARAAVRKVYDIPDDASVFGTVRINNQERYFAFLPHPNAWEGPWTFTECLSSEELVTLRDFLGVTHRV